MYKKSWNNLSKKKQIEYAKKSNWCWWQNKYIKILNKIKPPGKIFFKASCIAHDWWYEQWWNIIDKIIIDFWFLKYMSIDIKNHKSNVIVKIYYFILAIVYYIAVSIFWIIYFNFKK